MTQDMGSRMIIENNIFPRWEHNIPTLGTKHSQTGNKMGLRLALNDITSRAPRHYVSCLTTFLRPFSSKRAEFGQRLVVTLLLMLCLGVSEAWGQQMTDFEGVWYIASNGNAYQAGTTTNLPYTYNSATPATNFYLRPAADPQIADETDAFFDGATQTKPFLTSNYTGHTDIALWILEKTNSSYTITTPSSGDDYYYTIRHVETGKYLVCDPYFSGTLGDKNDSRRKCMHLETKSWDATIPDKALFKIRYTKDESTVTDNFDSYCFIPKVVENRSYKYLNLADRNQPVNYGTKSSQYYGGLAGLYTFKNNNIVDDNSRFKFEQYEVAQPTIMFNNATNEVTITSSVTGAMIYYTTNGDTPTSELTAYSSPVTFTQTTPCTIKAIAVKSWSSGVEVCSEEATDNLQKVATPTITINADNSVTIACATDGATIYYKTGGDDPTTANGTQSTSIANILPSQGPIKAFAIKDGLINSNIATESNIPVKTITVSSLNGSLTSADPIVYNGNAHQPAFSITDGETTISSGEYTSTYSNNTNAGIATITIADNAGGDYNVSGSFTFTIAPKALTITADDKNVIYGSAAPTYTFSYSGFVNNEDATALTTAPTATCSYTSTSDVGTYDIVPSGGEATNYSFTYENGTLTVGPKTVKDDPNTEAGESAINIVLTDIPVGNFTYDGTAKTPTITVKDGETVIASSEYTLGLSDNTNAGTATVTITDKDGGNYNVSGATTFTINPAALTITPNDSQSKQFGDPDPVLTYASVGLIEGDELAGALGRAAGENAGSYAITQGTLNNSHNPNYAITVTTGKTFTITPKSLGDDTDPAENITIEITEANTDHVIVKQGGKTLRVGTAGTDYDYSISTTGDATTKYYEVTITGKNNYTGSFKAKFANVTFGTNDNNHYWGTFVSNNSDGVFAVPSNMEAYIVTSINASAGTVEVVPLDNIPEQVPVLLLSAVDAKGFMVNTKNDGNDPTGTNLLKVEDTAKEVAAAEIYLLYNGEFVLNAAGTLPAGKVYLAKSSGSAAPARLHIVRSQSTGIDNVQLSTSHSAEEHSQGENIDDIWYTVDGRRLSGKPTKKGLYLQNGKKMVVR